MKAQTKADVYPTCETRKMAKENHGARSGQMHTVQVAFCHTVMHDIIGMTTNQ